jgi:flagellin
MGMFINTNLNAMDAQRNLGITQMKLSNALQQLSSGLRVNTAADDAAGYAISQRMQAQVNGMNQGLKNAQDGVSMLQTAAGALSQTTAILQRMRELTVQAGSTTLSTSDRTAIGDELSALKDEINNIAQQTQFNGLNLLTGTLSTAPGGTLVTGPSPTSGGVTASVSVDVTQANPTDTFALSGVGGALTITATHAGGGTTAQTITVANFAAAGSSTLNFNALGVKVTLTADGAITGANIVDTGTNPLKSDTLTVAGSGAATYRVGANSTDNVTVSFGDMQATAIGTGPGFTIDDLVPGNSAVSDTTKADTLLASIDAAIDQVSAQDAALGASQNQMQAAIASLNVSVENASAAEAGITNADVAQVSSQLVTQQILQQAGIAVLAQANTAPQAILKLLQ